MCLLEIYPGNGRIFQFESFLCYNKDGICVGRNKLEGSMLPHPVHS